MSDDPPISRRELLRGRLFDGVRGFLADMVSQRLEQAQRAAEQVTGRGPGQARSPYQAPLMPVHRPPGAVAEARFLDLCTRCNDCITACPHYAIQLAPMRFRQAAGTPWIDPMASPCKMCPDMPCIAACPTGALSPTEPVQMATAQILPHLCLAHQGTECTACSEGCPVPGALTVDEGGLPVVEPDLCTGCGVCQYVCPASENAVLLLAQ